MACGHAGARVTGGAVPYAVGDWIEHDALGERRESIVLERRADIKEDGRGAPGFHGFCTRPGYWPVWGFDAEVLRVIRHGDDGDLEHFRGWYQRRLGIRTAPPSTRGAIGNGSSADTP
jgi:hypothetical protein